MKTNYKSKHEKACLKRCVLRSVLKQLRSFTALIFDGNLFQSLGADAINNLSPKDLLVMVLGGNNCSSDWDQTEIVVVQTEILHILRKLNNCFIIHSKYFLLLKGVSPLRALFFRSLNIAQPCPQVFSVNGSIICSGLHFWPHFDVINSILRRFFPNLVNNSWLWWIMRVVLTNQKRENILNE